MVGLTKRTDGVWRWDDAVSHYVRRYGLSPGADFLAYLQDRDYQVPQVSAAEVSAVIDEIVGAPDAAPEDHAIRLMAPSFWRRRTTPGIRVGSSAASSGSPRLI